MHDETRCGVIAHRRGAPLLGAEKSPIKLSMVSDQGSIPMLIIGFLNPSHEPFAQYFVILVSNYYSTGPLGLPQAYGGILNPMLIPKVRTITVQSYLYRLTRLGNIH